MLSPSAPGLEEIKCLEESLAKGHEWLEKALRAGLPERASFWELVLAKNLVCKKIKNKNKLLFVLCHISGRNDSCATS